MSKTMSNILEQLNQLVVTKSSEINQWFEDMGSKHQPCFYNSVDIRNSGHKIAPVDTNCFPAGFNNLSPASRALAVRRVMDYVQLYHPLAKQIFLLPESHTRNERYLDNLVALKQILTVAGMKVTLGGEAQYVADLQATEYAERLSPELFCVRDGLLQTDKGLLADLVLTNNDLTAGIPPLLTDILQAIIPDVQYGWYRRRKSQHFSVYNNLVDKFAESFQMDAFQLMTQFHRCGQINFKDKYGIECLAVNTEKIIHLLKQKYEQYGIKEAPYVYIKADNGTYGMGIMTARSGDEVYEMNKKSRNKMEVIKNGVISTEVIIQEGVMTTDRVGEDIAESLVYLIGGSVVGRILRVNSERDEFGNLNSAGMYFKDAARIDGYDLVARLASLAAAVELTVS
jgi:glutamate--cysteine ligase